MNCNSCGKEITKDYYINSGNGAITFCGRCVLPEMEGRSLNNSKGTFLKKVTR